MQTYDFGTSGWLLYQKESKPEIKNESEKEYTVVVEIEIEPDGAWVRVWSSVDAVDNTLVIPPGN